MVIPAGLGTTGTLPCSAPLSLWALDPYFYSIFKRLDQTFRKKTTFLSQKRITLPFSVVEKLRPIYL